MYDLHFMENLDGLAHLV